MGKIMENLINGHQAIGTGLHVRSQARADVAELRINIDKKIVARLADHKGGPHVHVIHARKVLSLTEFKQMFYARGDDHFCLAQVYDCPGNTNSILSSVWGKRHDNDPNNPMSKVLNFNRLGGRHDSPPGVEMAYGYPHDINRTFFAQFEVMGHIERDICVKREKWTTHSRKEIEDQLYSLALVPEKTDDLCATVTCGRDWSEVEDALVESHEAADNILDLTEYVDLYINVEVVPNDCMNDQGRRCKPTIIRIRYTVSMRRGPDDHGMWNVRASDTASNIIKSGISHDAPQGGSGHLEDTSVITSQHPNAPNHHHHQSVSDAPNHHHNTPYGQASNVPPHGTHHGAGDHGHPDPAHHGHPAHGHDHPSHGHPSHGHPSHGHDHPAHGHDHGHSQGHPAHGHTGGEYCPVGHPHGYPQYPPGYPQYPPGQNYIIPNNN
jgi:hypothetical protein